MVCQSLQRMGFGMLTSCCCDCSAAPGPHVCRKSQARQAAALAHPCLQSSQLLRPWKCTHYFMLHHGHLSSLFTNRDAPVPSSNSNFQGSVPRWTRTHQAPCRHLAAWKTSHRDGIHVDQAVELHNICPRLESTPVRGRQPSFPTTACHWCMQYEIPASGPD